MKALKGLGKPTEGFGRPRGPSGGHWEATGTFGGPRRHFKAFRRVPEACFRVLKGLAGWILSLEVPLIYAEKSPKLGVEFDKLGVEFLKIAFRSKSALKFGFFSKFCADFDQDAILRNSTPSLLPFLRGFFTRILLKKAMNWG